MPDVNPKILVWARETAGLDMEIAAKKLGLTPANLQKMEAGDKPPTRNQLYNMSHSYRRSLLTFYLEKPPRAGDYGEDFRTLDDTDPLADANLKALMRDIKVRQMLVSDALEEEESQSLKFIGSASLDDKPAELAKKIRIDIDFDLKEFRKRRNKQEAFKYLRKKMEGMGVFVLLLGNLGSHHSKLSTDIFRGFVLADDYAPFIVINPDDGKGARAFTVLHELVHLYLGQTGISGALGSHKKVEKFCDSTAAEILLPSEEFENCYSEYLVDLSQDALIKRIVRLSEKYKVSNSMFAYKLYSRNKINYQILGYLLEHFGRIYRQRKEEEKKRSMESPVILKPAQIAKIRLGELCSLTRSLMQSESITYTKAAKILGVKAASVGELVREL